MALSRVSAFRVVAEDGKASAFAAGVGVRVFARDGLRRNAEELTPSEQEHLDRCLYPMFRSFPFHAEAATSLDMLMVGGLQVLFTHAPAELQFHLPPGRHVVAGGFGILDAASEGDNRTDGVLFGVARQTGTERTVVVQRLLQPLSAREDRGIQRFRVEVDAPTESILLLTADAGPQRDNRWDWSYWTDVSITPR
jgi:hypothetical protein